MPVLLALSILLGCQPNEPVPPPPGAVCEDPTRCADLQTWPLPPSYDGYHKAFDVADGRLAARSLSFLHTFDATVLPPEPQGSVSVGFGSSLALGDGVAFATTQEGLSVVDLADPAVPRVVGELALDGAVLDTVVVAEGRRAWVLAPSTGALWGVDATDAAAPEVVAELDVDAFDMGLSDDVLWMVSESQVRGLDLSVLPPEDVGAFGTPGNIDRFGIADGVLLASFWRPGGNLSESGFVRWDLSEPLAPALIDEVSVRKPNCGKGRLAMDATRAFLPCPFLDLYDMESGVLVPFHLVDPVFEALDYQLELVLDGDTVHAMPEPDAGAEGAPWFGWSVDGTEVMTEELRPGTRDATPRGMVSTGERLFVPLGEMMLVLEVDPALGPALVDEWFTGAEHGHDGVLFTGRLFLDAEDGSELPAVLPDAGIGVPFLGKGSTLAGMRDLTLVALSFDRTQASVLAELELEAASVCASEDVLCSASVVAVAEGRVAVNTYVSQMLDGTFATEQATVVLDLATGEQVAVPVVPTHMALGPGHLYGVVDDALVVFDAATGLQVHRLDSAAWAFTIADDVLVGHTAEGLQVYDLGDPARPIPRCLHPGAGNTPYGGQVQDGVWYGPHAEGIDWVPLDCE